MVVVDSDYNDWRVRGKCSTLSPEQYDKLFFPEGRSIHKAKAFCQGCPVSTICLETALSTNAEGIWAGTGNLERQNILKFRNKAHRKLIPAVRRTSFTFS